MAICYVTEILRYGSALNNDVILWMSPILTDVATYSCSHYPRSRSSAHAPSSACWMETQVSRSDGNLRVATTTVRLRQLYRFSRASHSRSGSPTVHAQSDDTDRLASLKPKSSHCTDHRNHDLPGELQRGACAVKFAVLVHP